MFKGFLIVGVLLTKNVSSMYLFHSLGGSLVLIALVSKSMYILATVGLTSDPTASPSLSS